MGKFYSIASVMCEYIPSRSDGNKMPCLRSIDTNGTTMKVYATKFNSSMHFVLIIHKKSFGLLDTTAIHYMYTCDAYKLTSCIIFHWPPLPSSAAQTITKGQRIKTIMNRYKIFKSNALKDNNLTHARKLAFAYTTVDIIIIILLFSPFFSLFCWFLSNRFQSIAYW